LTALDLYSSLHDEHDLKKARQALIKRIGKIFFIHRKERLFI
jgi:tRNA1(Val) A37 N6-methylase TrmN6